MQNIKTVDSPWIDTILDWDFEDLYIFPEEKKAYLKKNQIISWVIKNINHQELKEFGIINERVSNSYSLEHKWNPLRIEKTINNTYCIRKLSNPVNFLSWLVQRDSVLMAFLSRTLSSESQNHSLLLSWATASGKTTFILSLLEFLNNYDENAFKNYYFYKYLSNTKGVKFNKKDVFEKNYKETIKNFKNFFKTEKRAEWKIAAIRNLIKTSNFLSLIKKYNKKVVYTLENPIEYFFDNKNLLFNQNAITKTKNKSSEKNFVEAISSSLRFDPNLVYVSEVRTSKEYNKLLELFEDGFPVIGTLHSSWVFNTIQKLIEYGKANNRTSKGVKQAITSWIGWLIHLKRYSTKSWDFLSSYEFLEFSDNEQLKARFENSDKVTRFQNWSLRANYISEDNYHYYISHTDSLLYRLYTKYTKTKRVYDIKKMGYEDIVKLTKHKNLEHMSNAYFYNIPIKKKQLSQNLNKFCQAYLDYYKENKSY